MSLTDTDEQQIIEHIVPAELPPELPPESLPEIEGEVEDEVRHEMQEDELPAELPAAEVAAELAELERASAGSEPSEAVEELEANAPLSPARQRSVIESLLLVADRPLPVSRIVELLEATLSGKPASEARPAMREAPPMYQPAEVQSLLLALAADYRDAGRGMELHQVAGGWQLRTAPENALWVQRLLQQKPTRLARAQLEVLAIVAYRQPITRPEIDDVRGVDSGGALKTLLERRLVRILGKKEEPGRPLLYGTTREFLEFFNLRDLKELPTLREYYDLSEENQAKVRAAHGEVGPAEKGAEQQELAAAAVAAAQPGTEPAPPLAAQEAPAAEEILDRQLADDAEQLSKIDELIGSVPTQFPELEAVFASASGVAPDKAPAPAGAAKTPVSADPAAAAASEPATPSEKDEP